MITKSKAYEAPEIVRQGSAIAKTAASDTGSCYDGNTNSEEYNECPCSGSGHDCKPELF